MPATENAGVDVAQYGPWAVIAGGSEGVGSALAERLAARGFSLLLLARKPGPLDAVAADLRGRFGTEVRTLSVDLTSDDGFAAIVEAAAGLEVGLLIYNAGADNRLDYFLDRPLEVAERMIMLNVMTPTRLARQFGEGMAQRGRGGIVLCSSLAGLAGRPTNAVYSAAKAYANTLAEVLWFELGTKGVDVLGAIFPFIRTPAMERLGMVFDGPTNAADPFDIADETLANLRNGPALHAGGTHERAMRLRGMERNAAVLAIAGVTEEVPRGQGQAASWKPEARS